MNVQMRVTCRLLQTFRNSSTRSHASEGENRRKNCKCKRSFLNINRTLFSYRFKIVNFYRCSSCLH
jgi:hypothetical protein